MNTTQHMHHESPSLAHEMRPVLPSLSKLLERTWNFFTEHARLLALIGLPVFVASVLSLLPFMANSGIPDLLPSVIALNSAVGLILKLIYVAVSLIWPLALVRAISLRRNGRDLTLEDSYEPGWEVLGQYAIVLILSTVISCLASFVFIVPGIYLQLAFSFVLFVMVSENKRGLSVLTTSMCRVKGYWWPVFGRLVGFGVIMFLAFFLLTIIVAPLVSVLFSFAHIQMNMYHLGNLIGQAVQIFIGMPLFYVFLSELYYSLHSINSKDLSVAEHKRSVNMLAGLSVVGLLAGIFWIYLITLVLSLAPIQGTQYYYHGGMMRDYRYGPGMMVRPY